MKALTMLALATVVVLGSGCWEPASSGDDDTDTGGDTDTDTDTDADGDTDGDTDTDSDGDTDTDTDTDSDGDTDTDTDGDTDTDTDSDSDTDTSSCVPTGPEDCDDGLDNDCNGLFDCPVIATAYPEAGRAAAGNDIDLTFATPVLAWATIECRTARVEVIDSVSWSNCDGSVGTGLVHGPTLTNDGLTRTEIRIAYPDSTYSEITTYEYYVHTSLNGAVKCTPTATYAAMFAKAAERLPDTGDFVTADTQLNNPFISIDFDPPVSSTFAIEEGDGPLDALSLRRRFALNADGDMLLMTRNYQSRRNPSDVGCAVIKDYKVHVSHRDGYNSDTEEDNTRHFTTTCDAVVFNTHGAAACLTISGSTVDFHNLRPNTWNGSPFNVVGIDHFMWRRFINCSGDNDAGDRHCLFSAKCWDGGSSCSGGDADILYLPDHDLFFSK